MESQETLDTLNSFLRGEVAASETYAQAIAKTEGEPVAMTLQELRSDHQAAAQEIRNHIQRLGGQPDETSGVWGVFAKAVEGTAKVFGKTAAFKALKEGEEHGINAYEGALNDAKLPEECRSLIRTRLLPNCRIHIHALDRLMTGA